MTKTKFVLGLATVVAMFAVTTAPALALFTNHGGKGKGTGGTGTFTYESATVTCASAEGNYKVSSNGVKATLEQIKWNKCKSTIGTEATVTCKTLELQQPNKEGETKGTATGTVTESCTVSTAGCIITIGVEGNKQLKTVGLTKSKTNLEANAKVTGITATTNGNIACSLGGASKTKTTEATEITTFTGEGLGIE